MTKAKILWVTSSLSALSLSLGIGIGVWQVALVLCVWLLNKAGVEFVDAAELIQLSGMAGMVGGLVAALLWGSCARLAGRSLAHSAGVALAGVLMSWYFWPGLFVI